MVTHSDKQLEISSKHLIYHVKMYVETFFWLHDNPRPTGWDTVRNAVLESHLIHARVLINFIQYETPKRKTDVVAINYLHDHQSGFLVLKKEFLKEQAEKIGGQLVHLTTKSPLLKSEQEWQIDEVATSLIPVMREFLSVVPNHRLPMKINIECKELIETISSRLFASTNPLSTSVST